MDTYYDNARFYKAASFFRTGRFVDCTFKLKGQEVKAHKLILACASPVFEKMFSETWESNEIFVEDVDFDVFNQMLDYIYTYDVKITSVIKAWSLFCVAERYYLKELMQLCVKHISSNLTMSTLGLSFEYSDFYNLHDLKRRCLSDLAESLNAVVYCDYHIKPSTMRAALKENRVVSKEGLVFCVIKWAIEECNFKDINVTAESVVQIIKDEDIIQYISKDGVLPRCEYCAVTLPMCRCADKVISEIFLLISKQSVCQEHRLKGMLFEPMEMNLCRMKQEFKIARRIDFVEGREFVSNVAVNSAVMVFGLVLCTEMRHHSIARDAYYGTIAVRFCESNSGDIVKPTVMRAEYLYDSEVYVALKFPVTLVPEKMYDIRISYRNLDSKFVSSAICSYMSSELSYSRRGSLIVNFFDPCGTIVKGVAFYPA